MFGTRSADLRRAVPGSSAATRCASEASSFGGSEMIVRVCVRRCVCGRGAGGITIHVIWMDSHSTNQNKKPVNKVTHHHMELLPSLHTLCSVLWWRCFCRPNDRTWSRRRACFNIHRLRAYLSFACSHDRMACCGRGRLLGCWVELQFFSSLLQAQPALTRYEASLACVRQQTIAIALP